MIRKVKVIPGFLASEKNRRMLHQMFRNPSGSYIVDIHQRLITRIAPVERSISVEDLADGEEADEAEEAEIGS